MSLLCKQIFGPLHLLFTNFSFSCMWTSGAHSVNYIQACYDIHMFFGSLVCIANLNIKHDVTAEFLTNNGNFIHWGNCLCYLVCFVKWISKLSFQNIATIDRPQPLLPSFVVPFYTIQYNYYHFIENSPPRWNSWTLY
jgi:hypothetical protein